jgi:hypothetical protein
VPAQATAISAHKHGLWFLALALGQKGQVSGSIRGAVLKRIRSALRRGKHEDGHARHSHHHHVLPERLLLACGL